MDKKSIFLILLTTFLGACSTIKTISPSKSTLHISYHGKKSYCTEVSRIYSGLIYNLCKLNGEPSYQSNVGGTVNDVPLFLLDTLLSTAADTIVLPYTIYTQERYGSIEVR
ncbi:YceK/YidQ family lipoprotein [Vibrio diabolicus]|uniref:YceK/YidQ family lipoprotein n=1 Tax=Vibrio diabolicus TaxID=50719 RepID=UPI00215F1393|nr:YceK/YidQ family lipoprotein [Vibrio diabolicus]MCS0306582.1 YceK/YidQ family lipoprotein [Vibrio diabolicus]